MDTGVAEEKTGETRSYASKLSVLRKHPMFSDLASDAMDQLCRYAKLSSLKRGAVIDDFTIGIPLLDVLAIPEAARLPTDNALIATARANRSVDLLICVTYGPAVHRLRVTLQPKF